MKQQYYAVNQGRKTGVYFTWNDCQEQVKGYSGAVFKKFNSLAEAQAFLGNGRQTGSKDPSYSEQTIHTAPTPAPLSKGSGNTRILSSKSRSSTSTARHNPAPTSSNRKSKTVIRSSISSAKSAPVPYTTTRGKPYTIVYTDGAASKNGRSGCKAGVGVYFGPNDPRNVSEPLILGRATNQRAELQAIQRALEQIPKDEPINICTDSQYSIKCYEQWFRKWERNDWKNSKGVDVENQDLIRNTLQTLRERTAPTKFTHVKGHSGIHGNEMADQLAREGASKHGCYL